MFEFVAITVQSGAGGKRGEKGEREEKERGERSEERGEQASPTQDSRLGGRYQASDTCSCGRCGDGLWATTVRHGDIGCVGTTIVVCPALSPRRSIRISDALPYVTSTSRKRRFTL